MSTPEELIEQYKTDHDLKKEVDAILEDNKISLTEFLTFTKNHDLNISVTELPKIVALAKKNGLIK